MFETRQVIDAAARVSAARVSAGRLSMATSRAALSGTVPAGLATLARPGAPMLRVDPALAPVLPDGLRRGSTVAVSGSVALVLAVLGAASADGAWCALVGMPAISAEAARDFGIELSRLPLVPSPGSSWVEVVGALLDAVDVVVARTPGQLADGDIRRLAARTRAKGAVFVPYFSGNAHRSATGQARTQWPHADVRLSAQSGSWSGIGLGYGRLRQRQVTVTAVGRGSAARLRSTGLWLPTPSGGVEPYVDQPLATVVTFESASEPTSERTAVPAELTAVSVG
jgi:hypothetical protein